MNQEKDIEDVFQHENKTKSTTDKQDTILINAKMLLKEKEQFQKFCFYNIYYCWGKKSNILLSKNKTINKCGLS